MKLIKQQAIDILTSFYGQAGAFCSVRLEAVAVQRLGQDKAQKIIRTITRCRLDIMKG